MCLFFQYSYIVFGQRFKFKKLGKVIYPISKVFFGKYFILEEIYRTHLRQFIFMVRNSM